jgi:type IV secretory pathway TraG/TraD family ATPase VirD4
MLSTDLETAGMVKSLQEALERKASAQLAGVLSTLQSTLVTINNPKIFWVLTGSDFTMDLNDPEHPKMLCIGTSEDTAESLSPVVSCMVTVAIKQLNKKNRQHSIVLLDEAPQLFIPKLSNLPATGRSNKVVTMFMAQNIPQIIQLYSKQETDSILGNLSTQFFGRSRDLQTAEYVSKIFGREEKVNASFSTNVNQNDSRSYGRNESFQMKELVKSQEVYNLKTGYFYGVTIEAKNPTFHGKIQIPDPSTVKLDDIPVFTPDATDENINKNYARIRFEITALLAGEIPRDKPEPNAA